MDIRKSDGRLEEFDLEKLKGSICAAYSAIGEQCNDILLDTVAENFYRYNGMHTTEIRKQVEEWLMTVNKKAAKAYIENNNDGKDIRKKQDFIRSYIEASNAATGSKFDANANVTKKNIVTLGQELYKENNIRQNRYILTSKIASMYSKKLARQYLSDLESHVLYKHDETGTPGYPYTYSSKEVVEVVYNGKSLLLPFDLLYDIVDEPEAFVDEERVVYQKTPKNLFVRDLGGSLAEVTKLTRKKRHRPLVRVKTSYGEDVVVTDNHPMIVDKDNVEETVEAKDVLGMRQYKDGFDISFRGLDSIDLKRILPALAGARENDTVKRYISAGRDLGYIVGFFAGNGYYEDGKTLCFIQDDNDILEHVNDMMGEVFGVSGTIRRVDELGKHVLELDNECIYELFGGYFMILDGWRDRTLPCNILEHNEDFAKGCLEGLVDSEGVVSQDEDGTHISIRFSSRACVQQAAHLFRHFGYAVENLSSIAEAMWGVDAIVCPDSERLDGSFKVSESDSFSDNPGEYKTWGYVKVTDVEFIDEGSAFCAQNDFIYDITTVTHTFLLNNVLVHNCVAITMYPFLLDGLVGLGGISTAPTDLKSFCGEFINLVYSVSSQFLGAVATPEFLMYMDYFIRKDYGDDYLERIGEVVDRTVKMRTLEKVIDNCFQQVVHSMNMPAGNRGYQCVREDTTQLMTPDGFKYLRELKEGDECYVWKDGKLHVEPIRKLNVHDFDGELYQFKGRNYQQTVTGSHRVLYKVPNTDRYNIKEAVDLFGHSKLSLPIGSEGVEREDFPIGDELLRLCVVTLTDGSIDGVVPGDINSGRITIYKSKNRWGYREIPELLKTAGIGYNESEITGNEYGDMVQFRIPKIESQIILRQINHTKKSLPRFMKMLSKRQIDIVLDTWSKTDGYADDRHCVYLQCDNTDIQDDLQEIAFLGGYGTKAYSQECDKFDGSGKTSTNYVKIFKRKDKRVSEYNKVRYTGKVWCPTTDAGVVVFREENGIPYISGNSVFWNISYFDHEYFEGVFGDFRFPDGTAPKWETLSWLQKKFMKWFNEERTKYVLTFPVETMALLTDGGSDFIDKEYADFTAEMWSEGHSFFCYLSNSPDSLSSCCFDENQKVLWKSSTGGVHLTTLKELHDLKWNPDKRNLKVFHNGSWVSGKSVKLPNRKMYRVVTMNNKVFNMTDNHINVTLDGEKTTEQLTTSDYLMFNTLPLNKISELDEHLTYEEGFVVGMFLGDGSFDKRDAKGIPYCVNFSLNKEKYGKTIEIINKANSQLGNANNASLCSEHHNVYPVRLSSKEMINFIIKWTNWAEGTYSHNKELNLDCLLQSLEFRKGILDGWYATDGGNSNRCYTTSPKLAECMEVLITSLGLQSVINISDRTDEKTVIRDVEFSRNYPLYCVRWYEQANHRSNKDTEKSWIKKNNSLYFKIKSIEEIEYDGDVYCIECNNENEPYFTLPSGLITHNCRLRNSLKDLDEFDESHNHTTHQYSMGTASVSTGSKSVMTINLPRLVQNAANRYYHEVEDKNIPQGFQMPLSQVADKDKLYAYIREDVAEMVERVHKYQTAFNETIKDFLKAGMLDVYNAGFIDIRKQYLTVGVNGITDAAEFFGIKVSVNDTYKEFVNNILETINMMNRKDKTRDTMFNCEFVPAENLAAKNYKWDKKDGYWVSPDRNLYSSYFYNPEDDGLSVIDKMKLHGEDYVKYLDGGSALHANLREHLSKEQYRHLLNVAAENGCNYFTYNIMNSCCEDCGHIDKHTVDKCPVCGGERISYLTRVIGYLKKINSFSEARQIEADKRFYM